MASLRLPCRRRGAVLYKLHPLCGIILFLIAWHPRSRSRRKNKKKSKKRSRSRSRSGKKRGRSSSSSRSRSRSKRSGRTRRSRFLRGCHVYANLEMNAFYSLKANFMNMDMFVHAYILYGWGWSWEWEKWFHFNFNDEPRRWPYLWF